MGLQGTDRVSALLSKQWSVKNEWPSAREWLSRGANSRVLRCNAGNYDNCSYTHTEAGLHKSAHCTGVASHKRRRLVQKVLTAPVRFEHSQ